MPTLLDLAVMERDLSVALCAADSETEAVRATLSAISGGVPASGVSIRYPLDGAEAVESAGPLGLRAQDLVFAGPGDPAPGASAVTFSFSETCGLSGRLSFVEDRASGVSSPVAASVGRSAKMLSAALCRIAGARRLAAAEQERELLVRELRHRMRNSLQLVKNSITFLLGTTTDVPPEVLAETDERLTALVVLHEMLGWAESSGKVSAETYFLRLAEALRRLIPSGVGTLIAYYDAETDAFLPVDRAATIGLIVHELAMNAVKHAGGRLRRMTLRVDVLDGELRLRYADTPVDPFLGEITGPSAVRLPRCGESGGSGLGIIRALLSRTRGRRLDDGSDFSRFDAAFPLD